MAKCSWQKKRSLMSLLNPICLKSMLSNPIAQDAPGAMAQEAAEAAVEVAVEAMAACTAAEAAAMVEAAVEEDSALDEAVAAEVETEGTEARIPEIREAEAEREGNFPSFFSDQIKGFALSSFYFMCCRIFFYILNDKLSADLLQKN